MQNSVRQTMCLPCGHSMHKDCLQEYSQRNHSCPLCKKSFANQAALTAYMDAELARTPMHADYANHFMKVLCYECSHTSQVKYHILGGKCAQCSSYNTT